MQITIHDTTKNIAECLADTGLPLDMRCGGRGTCGRCKVQLLSGSWLANGKMVAAPAFVLACHTRLLSGSGIVDIQPSELLPVKHGVVADGWQTSYELPVLPEVVIGIDIGTTTLAAAALCEGRIIARISQYNPQNIYGDNVISRISAAPAHLDDMRNVLLEALRNMLQKLPCPTRVAIAGNSTMTCIFHGIDPTPIGRMPFNVPKRNFTPVSGACLGLSPEIPVATVPLLTAYLGGDILGGFSEVNLKPGDAFVDLGTNCEMVFRAPDGSYCGTAAAAGPAFEGSGLSCGMRAVPGAISAYRSAVDFEVIGSVNPMGLCGSGMIDVLAMGRANGTLSTFGRCQPASPTLTVTDGVAISESDIESLLKAKAAVFAGIQTIEEHCHIHCNRIVLAGGFAQFINLDNAVAIGLLPKRDFKVVGNTSLASAVHLAAEPEHERVLETLQDCIPEIPLNMLPDFEDNFIDALMLP